MHTLGVKKKKKGYTYTLAINFKASLRNEDDHDCVAILKLALINITYTKHIFLMNLLNMNLISTYVTVLKTSVTHDMKKTTNRKKDLFKHLPFSANLFFSKESSARSWASA